MDRIYGGPHCGQVTYTSTEDSNLPINLSWRKHVGNDFHVNISFTEFKLAFSVDNCNREWLKIVDSGIPFYFYKLIIADKKLCGWRIPWNLYIQTNIINATFYSNIQSKSYFSFFYSIYQRGAITETQSSPTPHQSNVYTQMFLNVKYSGRNVFVETTYIKSTTTYQIQAKIPVDDDCPEVIAYDGPFASGVILAQNNQIYQSSGFLLTLSDEK